MIAGAVLLVVAGVVVQRVVGSGFLPEIDEGAFVLDYFTPGGTPLAETDRQVHIAERILAREPEMAGTSRRTGAELGLFATEQNRGDIVVRLKPGGSAAIEPGGDRRRARKINRARAAAAHRVRADPLRRHQRISPVPRSRSRSRCSARTSTRSRLREVDRAEDAGIDGMEDLFSGVSEPAPEMRC